MTDDERRHDIEAQIMRATITALLGAGYRLSVFDGEATTVHIETDPDVIFAAMKTTDQDYLFATRGIERDGWVRFVYGNAGHDVIADNTFNLADVLKPVCDFADTLEEGS